MSCTRIVTINLLTRAAFRIIPSLWSLSLGTIRMKIMIRVLDGESIRHIGDLKIRGDVGAHATILVENGSLMIEGDVGEGSRICVSVSEAPEPISFEAKSISAHMVTYFAGETVYIGHVNVDDRIFTDAQLKICDKDCYEITVPNPEMTMFSLFPSAQSLDSTIDLVEAVVDKKRYQGTKITILGKTVIVDGLQKWPVYTTDEVSAGREWAHPSKVCINGSISDNVILHSDISIQAKSIGKHCALTSVHGGITADDIGPYARLTAEKLIKTKRVDSYCSLLCQQEGISTDNIGSRTNIHAKGRVLSNNVGNHVSIVSTHGSICIGDIGEHTQLRSLYDIDILGACLDPRSISLESHRGRVHKPIPSLSSVTVSPISLPDICASNKTLGDSRFLSSAAKTSLFAPVTKRKGVTKSAIPNGFICPISMEIMDDPVLLSLDEHSYERKNITSWLKSKGTSPMTRKKMLRTQNIEDVLVTNRALADAIKEFRETNRLSESFSHG